MQPGWSAGHIGRPRDRHAGPVKPNRPASFESRTLSDRLTKKLQLVGQYRLLEDLTGLQSMQITLLR